MNRRAAIWDLVATLLPTVVALSELYWAMAVVENTHETLVELRELMERIANRHAERASRNLTVLGEFSRARPLSGV